MVLSKPLNAPYARLGTIDSPTDTVNALTFSVDACLLASAGDDRQHKGSCAFTAVAWRDSILFVGNMDSEIITFHPTKDHLPRPGPFGETENYSHLPILAMGARFLGDDDCLLAYLHNGFWKFKFNAWENRRSWGPEEKIAAMAKSPDSTAIVTTNMFNGLSWFKITPENVKQMGTSVDVRT
ncbi:hypothetical protein F5876DRAFT_70299 [Lentinula aff. lateritia]|uniref:Uncharacterized protein n=1 Tax=Lentinula aff. lateritia TaxID=2804960 RepID=A0ACC1TJJ0_9AGAR|nr:hypothetical protein F5876DRAFT_70299 [Lentinula aff. lateritia]